MKLIDKDALVAEIERRIKVLQNHPKENHKTICHLDSLKQALNSLEVKEVDFDAEWERYFEHRGEMATVNVKHLAKHFFELGMQVGKPITAADRGMAEEIIINLKRVEQDYRINLTKEMEWLRNKVKKGE